MGHILMMGNLYKILTGKPPLKGPTLRGEDCIEMYQVCECDLPSCDCGCDTVVGFLARGGVSDCPAVCPYHGISCGVTKLCF